MFDRYLKKWLYWNNVHSFEKYKNSESALFKRAVRSQQPSLFFPQGPYLLHDVGLGYQRVFIAYWKNSICNLLSPLSARPLFLLCCFLITSWQVEWSRIHVGNLILQKDNYEWNDAFPTTNQCYQLLPK